MKKKFTYQEIATLLRCSERTVKRYVQTLGIRPVSIRDGQTKEFTRRDTLRLQRAWRSWIKSQLKNTPIR